MSIKIKSLAATLGLAMAFSTTASFANKDGAEVAATGETLTWSGCGITRKAFVADLARAYTKKTGVNFKIEGGGAGAGIRNAASGKRDLGGTCRYKLDKADEAKAKLIPVAWDAITAIVHPENPVKTISSEQLKAVFEGKINNWKELGGNDAAIKLYSRKSKNSGVGRTFRERMWKNPKVEFTGTDTFVKSTGPAEKAVEADVNAFAVTGISSAKKRKVKILALDGVDPTYDAIKDGKYQMFRPLYLVKNIDSTNPHVDGFIAFANSPEGREIIKGAGTVPYLDALGLMMIQLRESTKTSSL